MAHSKKSSPGDLILPLLNTVVSALYINLVSSAIWEGKRGAEILASLGWWNLLIPLWIATIFWSALRIRRERLRVQQAYRSLTSKYAELYSGVVRKLFQLLAEAAIYPKKSASLNLQVFHTERRDGATVLVKDRKSSFELEPMSRNYALDYIDPAEDHLVVSESFLSDNLVYRVLSDQDSKGYNKRIRDKIDPSIGWVLSCPLHVEFEEPRGIICCYGSKLFFKGDEDRRYFETLLTALSEIVVRLVLFGEELERVEDGTTVDPSVEG